MKQTLLSFFVGSMILTSVAFAQEKKVSGRVTGADGKPLVGVTIAVQGSNQATQTDANGNYSFSVPTGKVIIFRSVGFSDKTLIVKEGQSSFNVTLEDSNQNLNEVVVTAYGVQKKEAITGSVVSVTSKDIEKRPVSSVTAVLEGIAPGIQVNNSYGEPGSSPSIRVRGFNSLNGSSAPIYVLDGVIFGGNISDLSPDNIESISVLKDATSAALYGAKGANGVIVITSKKAKKGSSNLNAIVNQGLYTRAIAEYDKLDAKEYMGVAWKGYRNQLLTGDKKLSVAEANSQATAGLIPSILKLNIFDKSDAELFDSNGNFNSNANIKGDYASDLDWFDQVSRTGYRQEYLLNGGAGFEKGGYYFSVGYLDEEAYVTTSDFKRLNARLSGDISPKSWIKAGMSMNASHQLSNNTTGEGSGFTNPWMFARNIAPIYPIHLHDATTGAYALDAQGNKIYDDGADTRNQYVGRHVIWENELNTNASKRNTVNTQAYVDFNITKDLKFSILGDVNLRYNEARSYNNAIIGDGSGNNGRGSRTLYNYKNYTVQQLLNYNKSFNSVHNFDVMAGHENYGNDYTYLYGYKVNQTFAGQIDLINFTEITSLTDYEYNDRSESYFSRLRYNYDEKYYLEGSFRRDGSSRVAPANRWGNFWSIGGTWMLSKENFVKDVDWVNALKLRASTGVVGNLESLGFYDYQALYNIGQNNNVAALYRSNMENLDLKWEGNQSSSFALEGRLFNRFNFNVEYFNKQSKDLIFDLNLPLSVGSPTTTEGTATVKKNIGNLVNSGFELTFDVDLIKKQDLRWNFGINATFLKNKIKTLPEQNRENGILSPNSPFKYLEGHDVFDYYLFQYAGVDMMTGQALYHANTKDYDPTSTTGAWVPFQTEVNGELYTTNSSYAKREFSGSAIPKVFGSFNTSLDYKNFSLSGLFTYSLGGKGLDYSYISLMSVTSTPGAVHKDVLNSWTEAPTGMTETSPDRINKDATPQINYTNSQYNNATSTRFLFDNSYFVFKNIALGYRIPKKAIEKINLSSLSVNFAVENVVTFTAMKGYSSQQGFDGTSRNQFVPARTFSLGINIGL